MSKIKSRISSQEGINSSRIISIGVAGDGGVGKTTSLNLYLTDNYDSNTKMTCGVQFLFQDYLHNKCQYKIKYIDLAGEEHWRSFQGEFIKGIDGLILMFDLTRVWTIANIKKWVSFFRDKYPNLPIILVGVKSDLINDINVDDDTISEFTEGYDFLDIIEISNKTGKNVNLPFKKLISHIIKLRFPEDKLLGNQNEIELKNLNRKVAENELVTKNSDMKLEKLDNKVDSLYNSQNEQMELLYDKQIKQKEMIDSLWVQVEINKDNKKRKKRDTKVSPEDIVKAIGTDRSITYARLTRILTHKNKDISKLEKKLSKFKKNGTLFLKKVNNHISEIIFEIDEQLENKIINLHGSFSTKEVSEKLGIPFSKAEFYIEYVRKYKTLNVKITKTYREGIKFHIT